MKQKILLFFTVLVLVTLSACNQGKNDGVAATVYNYDILTETINKNVENSKLVYETGIEQINNLDASDDEKEKLKNKLSKPKTYDEALNEKIEYYVLLHEAEKKKLDVDFESCEAEAKRTFSELNSISEDDFENYQSFLMIKNYMKENNLSDKEYIDLLAKQYYENAKINALKEYFKDELYVFSEIPFEQQFENYTQKLIKKAKIVYYD